jgi:hypothetical protein
MQVVLLAQRVSHAMERQTFSMMEALSYNMLEKGQYCSGWNIRLLMGPRRLNLSTLVLNHEFPEHIIGKKGDVKRSRLCRTTSSFFPGDRLLPNQDG